MIFFSEIKEGPIPVKITSLVWVFLGILSVLVLVLILAGALVRISNICARCGVTQWVQNIFIIDFWPH